METNRAVSDKQFNRTVLHFIYCTYVVNCVFLLCDIYVLIPYPYVWQSNDQTSPNYDVTTHRGRGGRREGYTATTPPSVFTCYIIVDSCPARAHVLYYRLRSSPLQLNVSHGEDALPSPADPQPPARVRHLYVGYLLPLAKR